MLLVAEDLARHYAVRRGLFGHGAVAALDGVDFRLAEGRTLAVVGESGSGKSTLARLVVMVEKPTRGRILLDGIDPATAAPAERRRLRRAVQMVFQDPYGSLNPRWTVPAILDEPLAINTRSSAAERRERGQAMLAKVGLRPEQAGRYPHMFSGGQRQRIAIARALVLEPRLLIADEPTSSLDVSIQAQVLNLLLDLKEAFGLAYLFISHNLAVVRHLADDVLVLYFGRPVEQAPRAALFAAPLHPYTRALLAATPVVGRGKRMVRAALQGELPSPLDPPTGCAFHSRCPYVVARCRAERPPFRDMGGRSIACHRAEEIG